MTVPQVAPEDFNVSPEAPEEGPFVASEASRLLQGPVHLDSALPPEFARRVVERTMSSAQPIPSRLTVKGKAGSISLELSLRADNLAPGFRLISDGTKGIKLVLESEAGKETNFRLDTNYAGLPISAALSYARFCQALSWREGTLFLSRVDAVEEKLELAKLPLPIDPSIKEVEEDRIRFLEALYEVGKATGTEFVYPSEVEDDDFKNLSRVLKVIRSGWIALPITDFTTPMNSDGIRNILEIVVQKGEVFEGLAMTVAWERHKIFDTWVDLGPSVRHISKARLVTPSSEMEKWLASGPELGDSFKIRWIPVEGAWLHIFYQGWPKPSLEAIREDIRAFEEDLGKGSQEFRRAWETGESWAHEIPDGDIWLTLLDAERHLEQRT
jgi:hypothetical protein